MVDTAERTARRHTTQLTARQLKAANLDDPRTPAQKDRDRLLYTSSLRRLAQVTQVVAADVSHVFHNRLTHSFQVAQVGRRLAEKLIRDHSDLVLDSHGVDPDVVEAACYAHDLGHPPFGHIVEEELNELAGESIDGFEGNAQSFRIVTKLSQHSSLHRGLDLTRATLAAVLKYPWLRKDAPRPDKWGAYSTEQRDFQFAADLIRTRHERTLEAQIMDWADDITYSVHDIDDFYRAHKVPLHLLASRRYERERDLFFEAVDRRHRGDAGIWRQSGALREAFDQVIVGLFPLDGQFSGTWKERADLRQFSSQLIGRYIGQTGIEESDGRIALKIDENLRREVAILKELTWVYVIEAPALVSQQFGQRHAIKTLFEIYMEASTNAKRRSIFPASYRDAIDQAEKDSGELRRIVIDLIAGMTENQAIAMYNRLIGVSVGSGLEEIVR